MVRYGDDGPTHPRRAWGLPAAIPCAPSAALTHRVPRVQIVRNHLINETITYSELQSITELGNTATYKSLGHTVWEFTNQGGGIKLVDTYDIGQGRTKGVLFIQADITNAKQGEW